MSLKNHTKNIGLTR